MALRWFFALTFVSFLFLPVPAATAQTLDQYGGYTALPVPGGATGQWRTAKLNNRWVFVTPLGNAFWMRGVYNVSLDDSTDDLGGNYTNRVLAKYGSVENWGNQEVKRLSSWGFNTVAEYADWRAWDKLPTSYLFSIVPYSLRRQYVTGISQAPKDLLNGVNLSIYKGYQANMVDFFDPYFASYVSAYMAANVAGLQPVYTLPRTIGFAADDRDYLYGFGAGPEVPAYSPHTHLGWIVLVTNFQQSSNAGLGQTYADTKVYGKYALRDQLVAKYGTIAALNAAWGSSYTTFDSAGGWGTGTGLLDEDGRHSWVPGDYVGLAGATSAMVTDLDNCLLEHARKYYSITTAAIRAVAPNALVFGTAALNSDGLTRKQILQAAGENVDVLQASIRNQTILNLTAQYFGDKPIVTYELMEANPDSAFWRYPLPSPIDSTWEFVTQQDRGAAYASKVSTLLGYTAPNGVRPIAGLKWWEFHDRWNEKGNYGLTTLSDNAYDGVQAVMAKGTDAWGYPTGGEERNYGNFLGAVITAHAGIANSLGAGTGSGTTTTSSGSTTTLTVAITTPQAGSTVSQGVTVSAAASSTTARIGLMLDGSAVAMVGGTTASYPWDTRTSSNGTHTWTANAYDAAGNSVSSAPANVVVQNSTGAGGTSPNTSTTAPATLTLAYNGKLRDRVGQGDTALGGDGALDGTLTATLHASGGRRVTSLGLASDAPGLWDTNNGNTVWVLGVAPTLDGALLNAPGTMAVNFAVADGASFVVFAADYQASEFLPGRTLTLTATFSDGSTATAVTTVPVAPATLTLAYNGKLRDRVGQGDTALGGDGALDGTLTATLYASGGRTVTSLGLASDAPGLWDTNNGNTVWVLGVAPTLDGALLNAPGTMAVNFAVADGASFVVFAADYQASEFLPGRTLTLTATFSDGSTATAVTTVPVAPATLTLAYNGKLRDRVGQGDTALGGDGALDGTLTATLYASGGRTVTSLGLASDAPGLWDTNNGNTVWVLGVAPTLDGALLNAPGTMAVNFAVADGASFVVFAADYQASEFLPGRTLTLTATFSDGSTATAVATAP